ncbi:MAG: hypothetical protein IT346_04370 [Epsilonproteobacteria bacterium]|nr:hypothetical protein [Campylobacterota bacterium]
MKTENRYLKRIVFAGLFAAFAAHSVHAQEVAVDSAPIRTGSATKKFDEFRYRFGNYHAYTSKAFDYSLACAMAAAALGKIGSLAGISEVAIGGSLLVGVTGILVAAMSFSTYICLDAYEDVLMDKVIAEERACQAQAAA